MLHRQHQSAVIRSRKVLSRRRRDGLIRFASDRTSQNGEDGIIERIFQLLPVPDTGIDMAKLRKRVCVDVGAWDGIHLSNTHSLLFGSDEQWLGVLIEADPHKFMLLSALHAGTSNSAINLSISVMDPYESPNSLHSILGKHEFFDADRLDLMQIDFLCIDIDGSDYYVFHDLMHCSRFRPTVICVEFNPTMPDDLIYIPPRDDCVRHVS
jgi:hypothetical protein